MEDHHVLSSLESGQHLIVEAGTQLLSMHTKHARIISSESQGGWQLRAQVVLRFGISVMGPRNQDRRDRTTSLSIPQSIANLAGSTIMKAMLITAISEMLVKFEMWEIFVRWEKFEKSVILIDHTNLYPIRTKKVFGSFRPMRRHRCSSKNKMTVRLKEIHGENNKVMTITWTRTDRSSRLWPTSTKRKIISTLSSRT